MKKTTLLILLVTIVFVMAGCGTGKEETTQALTEVGEITTEEVTTEDVITEEATTEETIIEEVITEEVSDEEVTSEEVVEVDAPEEAVDESDTITEQQALEAIKKYSYLQDPELKNMEDSGEYTIYWDVSTNDNNEIVVLYRSYTAAEIRYYINPSSGDTYVTEYVQGITDEEQKTEETLNIRDYMD